MDGRIGFCGGINVIITDRSRFRSVAAGLEIAVALRKLYASQWKVDDYLRLLVNSNALERLKHGAAVSEILRSWAAGLEKFREARAKALLYE